MSGQYSLTEKEIKIIKQIIKDHNIELIYERNQVECDGECEPEDQYNDVSIMCSEENEEKWYIQVN